MSVRHFYFSHFFLTGEMFSATFWRSGFSTEVLFLAWVTNLVCP